MHAQGGEHPLDVPERSEKPRSGAVVALAVISGVVAGLVGCVAVLLIAWPQLERLVADGSSSSDVPRATAQPSQEPAPPETSTTTLTVEGGDSQAIKEALAKAMPAVVHVTQSVTRPGHNQDMASGSGFIFDGEHGFVLTNAHVVAEDGAERDVYVKLASAKDDDDRLVAHRLAIDNYHDLAVLKIETTETLPELAFGDSDALEVGDWVMALGGPFGLDRTATLGIVSAKHRQLDMNDPWQGEKTYEDLIQTDAAINQGNSGGPLINLKGDVVGINSVIQSPTGTSAGIGFAIASNIAKIYVDEMMSRGYLGVTLVRYQPVMGTSLPPDGHFCEIKDVLPKGPADVAGLQKGDVFISINDKPITDTEEVVTDVGTRDPGEVITAEVFRPGDERNRTIEVTVGDRREY